jgi:hypothetical protein
MKTINKFGGEMKRVVLFICLISLFACSKSKKEYPLESRMQEWIGKEIFFPAKEEYQVVKLDTNFIEDDIFTKKYKIVLYVDSLGCTDCKLRLFEWQLVMEELEPIAEGNIGFLFFLGAKNLKEIQLSLRRYDFEYPVFVDYKDKILTANQFPVEQTMLQCFLLDENNRVLGVGNPALHSGTLIKYKELITNKEKRAENCLHLQRGDNALRPDFPLKKKGGYKISKLN